MPLDYVFVHGPPLTTSAAHYLAAERYLKLIPRMYVPYEVLSVGPDYLKVLQNGFNN